MKANARSRPAPRKLHGHGGAREPEKAKHVATKHVTAHHEKDGTDASHGRRKSYEAKVGGSVEVRHTPPHQSAAAPLSDRVNAALTELGVTVGMTVQRYDSGDWMDYAHSKKGDRAVQVITLGEQRMRYVLEERKGPDRLVLLDEAESETLGSAVIGDFRSFTEAVKAVLSDPLAEANAVRERMFHPRPAPAEASSRSQGPRQLSSEERTLLLAEARQLRRELDSLKSDIDAISRSYGYTRPWAKDQGREQFTLVNGRFDVLGYQNHLNRVKADSGKYDALVQQRDQKQGQLELKLAQLDSGLATDVR